MSCQWTVPKPDLTKLLPPHRPSSPPLFLPPLLLLLLLLLLLPAAKQSALRFWSSASSEGRSIGGREREKSLTEAVFFPSLRCGEKANSSLWLLCSLLPAEPLAATLWRSRQRKPAADHRTGFPLRCRDWSHFRGAETPSLFSLTAD